MVSVDQPVYIHFWGLHFRYQLPMSWNMPRKRKPPPDDPEQSKRFIEAAREIGTDESPEAFERVFKKVALSKPGRAPPTRGASRRSGRGR